MTKTISSNAQTQTLLRKVPYFQALNTFALDTVAREVTEVSYQAGQVIFWEGDPVAGLHLMVSGCCKVYRVSEGGREHVLAILGPGDSCNEVAAVDGGPNPANLVALEDSTMWVISEPALNRMRVKYPGLNDMIIKNLSARCRELVQRVYNLSFLSVTERLAVFLLQQADEQGELNRRRWTQDEIAAHLDTVREMVGRALKELQAAELITIERQRIQILDKAGLRQFQEHR